MTIYVHPDKFHADHMRLQASCPRCLATPSEPDGAVRSSEVDGRHPDASPLTDFEKRVAKALVAAGMTAGDCDTVIDGLRYRRDALTGDTGPKVEPEPQGCPWREGAYRHVESCRYYATCTETGPHSHPEPSNDD